MNDFTKDELEIIDHALYCLDTDLYGGCKEVSELLTKARALIDNYCDHDNLKSASDIDYVQVCVDCDEIVRIK